MFFYRFLLMLRNFFVVTRASLNITSKSNVKQQSLSLLTGKTSNLRTKETSSKKAVAHKERYGKHVKEITKSHPGRTTLNDLTSVVSEIKKRDDSKMHLPILMTTIDSDGIKSVTSAAGTHLVYTI